MKSSWRLPSGVIVFFFIVAQIIGFLLSANFGLDGALTYIVTAGPVIAFIFAFTDGYYTGFSWWWLIVPAVLGMFLAPPFGLVILALFLLPGLTAILGSRFGGVIKVRRTQATFINDDREPGHEVGKVDLEHA